MNAIVLRGLARLATEAVAGTSHVVEAVQQEILERLPLPARIAPRVVGGIAGLTHRGVRGIARAVGAGLDRALDVAAPRLARGPETEAERRLRAIANGVLGDHLLASGNPLALPMRIWIGDAPVEPDPAAIDAAGAATPRLLLMLHGLCMGPSQWRRGDHDHGEVLAQAHGFTPVRLEYNSGLRVARNGAELAHLLQQIHDVWPVPLQGIAILAHSMGGLVARSAIHQAREAGMAWPDRVRDLVFLGTPHFGAPLERIGHGVDRLLLATPWSAPLAKAGRLRSAGIVDLRHGAVLDTERAGVNASTHPPVPLPRGVRCRVVAASLHAPHSARAQRWIGDGLVPLDSALGRHPDPALALGFRRDSRLVIEDAGHFDLLGDARVGRRLLEWLAPPTRRADG